MFMYEFMCASCIQEPEETRGHWSPEELQEVSCLLWVLKTKNWVTYKSS